MKYIIFIVIIFLAGCATLTEDTRIDDSSISFWSVEDTYYGYHLQHDCNEGGRASVGIDKLLKREGKLYFIFFVLPIHSAQLSDRPYSGIKVTSRFPGGHQACSTSDVSLTMNGQEFAPDKATKSYLNDSDCEYTWAPEIGEKGHFSISFSGNEQCSVPPINLNYEKGSSYNYESLGT